ncbi:MAG: methyltransferase domain-containing protein [Opitutales bacterium]|nr:methyltransferase domain-containing protein [Opitutales bacterium]
MSGNKNIKSLSKRKVELKAISEWVAAGERVLDLGCGRGILLDELSRQKKIYGVGVDSDFEKIARAIKRGVNVYHGDILDMLSAFGDDSFDWIVCSRTLPELENAREVVMEALRVGRRVAVGFVNHAYWRNRLSYALRGERVLNEVFASKWDDSRPMNPICVNSFKEFCQNNDIRILRTHFLRGDWETPCRFAPNLLAGYAIFEISREK